MGDCVGCRVPVTWVGLPGCTDPRSEAGALWWQLVDLQSPISCSGAGALWWQLLDLHPEASSVW
ncbi:UNVERIFIED_CONTAM: hypothetical protein FKN15_022679 [Acipenser sinensis]